ncbi:hypothetical protein C8A05DRAFT_20583 [Staphylotrichum tortipilum]|uniref:DUF7689 domain-containing protein n=1 Tax=Staphylotrichum tortipilum TaxID=2831512 RepID=A0AAN6M8J3_9PEZI|nr:hypothetical protein C8A05DRAFT_20583 [Staphylotrichum longicolle]
MSQSGLSRFEQDIIADHSEAYEDGSNFVVDWTTNDPTYNCFAYAVNFTTGFITPQNMADLGAEYAAQGFFPVNNPDDPLLRGDVEVYASRGIPAHAHKVTNPLSNECASKMGYGPVIWHPRTMLQSPRRTQATRYKYGVIVARYRRDRAKYEAWYAAMFTSTTSGRTILRKDARQTSSGKIIHKLDAWKTKSGRITKKPSSKTTKSSQAARHGSSRASVPTDDFGARHQGIHTHVAGGDEAPHHGAHGTGTAVRTGGATRVPDKQKPQQQHPQPQRAGLSSGNHAGAGAGAGASTKRPAAAPAKAKPAQAGLPSGGHTAK